MKLAPVTKLDKRNKTTPKNLTMMSFFQFMANLELSGSRILDALSVTITFPLIVTFHLTKTQNSTKKSLIQFSHYCF